MKYSIILLFAILLGFCLASCKKDEPLPENYSINKWIYNEMKDVYFWNSKIATTTFPTGKEDTKEYFESLLNRPEDKWSAIIENFGEFQQGMDGKPTSMGYEAIYGKFSNTNTIFAVVKYVYDGSPSAIAGLKRGDIIIKIDGEEPTEDNYSELFSKDTYTLTLGIVENEGISESPYTITMSATLIDANPVLCEKIYTINSNKVGYLALSEFISEKPFIEKVQPSITKFKSENINTLIVDLRYNFGGDLNSAIWLASVLAPASNMAKTDPFVQLIFNEQLQPIAEVNGISQFNFLNVPDINLDLTQIYFLTTNYSTASASELVITGLAPYMNVIQIGENTIGKFMGMWVMPHDDNYWGILPLVFKYANAQGYTDFTDGLVPNWYINDDLFKAVPLGDENDPMIAKAIELISGVTAKTGSVSTLSYKTMHTDKQKLKMNGYLKITN